MFVMIYYAFFVVSHVVQMWESSSTDHNFLSNQRRNDFIPFIDLTNRIVHFQSICAFLQVLCVFGVRFLRLGHDECE